MSTPEARLGMAGDARRASFLDQFEADTGERRSRSNEGSSFLAGWMDEPVIAHVLPDRPALCLVVVEAR